ncbi:hypothetical protein BsWGS_23578 [Bradybaena similaris]
MSPLWGVVREIQIPEQKKFNGQLFPLVLAPEPDKIVSIEAACEWFKGQRANVANALGQYGAVVFRGFPLKDAYDFDKFVTSYGVEALPYIGGAAPRRRITEKVFTANEAPPDTDIFCHHNMTSPISNRRLPDTDIFCHHNMTSPISNRRPQTQIFSAITT